MFHDITEWVYLSVLLNHGSLLFDTVCQEIVVFCSEFLIWGEKGLFFRIIEILVGQILMGLCSVED